MQPVSLLLISDTYPPVIGGSETEAQRVASGLIRRGHRVEVWTSGGPPMPAVRDWTDPAGVPVRILTRDSRGRQKDFAFAFRVATGIWRRRHEFDLIYFLMQGLHLAAGLPVTRLANKPLIMKFGGSGVIPLMRSSRAGRVELEWLKKWADRLLVLNQGMIDEALADGFRREQLYWMPNPTDTTHFRPAEKTERSQLRAHCHLPETAFVVLYIGRLSHEKGLPWLLDGFARLAAGRPEALLVLLGNGALRGELESQAARLGIAGQVRLPGGVPPDDVAKWARAADVFALTSPSEGFSCALAEAMSSGLPAVLSDIPANHQLVRDQQEGLYVKTGQVEAIGQALAALAAEPDRRAAYGAAARERIVSHYSLDRVVNLYEELFADILERRATATNRGKS